MRIIFFSCVVVLKVYLGFNDAFANPESRKNHDTNNGSCGGRRKSIFFVFHGPWHHRCHERGLECLTLACSKDPRWAIKRESESVHKPHGYCELAKALVEFRARVFVAVDLRRVLGVAEEKELCVFIHYGLELLETELSQEVVMRFVVDEDRDRVHVSPVELELVEASLGILLLINIPAHAALDVEALVLETLIQTTADESLNKELGVVLTR